MNRFVLLLILTTAGCFLPSASSQSLIPTRTTENLVIARKQTAFAIRAIAVPEDAIILAKLGEFEAARKLANRVTDDKSSVLKSIAGYAAEDAIKTGEYLRAEREIKQANGATLLWLKLSKRYKAENRNADARRTAFYAVSQVQRERDTYRWGDVAVWLCELGEQPAARRLFAVAKKSLLDPDPLLGSPMDHVYEVAAECRFDDLIPKVTGIFVCMSLVNTYTKQNRDEMARRTIERTFTAMEQRYGRQIPQSNSAQPIRTEDSTDIWRALLYADMAFIQFKRGDITNMQAALKDVDSLLEKDNDHPEWLESKFILLMYCQYTAQWKLADKVEADIQEYLQKNSSKTLAGESEQSKHQYFARIRLAGFYVLAHPATFSLQERQAAFARLKPRAIQHAADYPNEKARIYLALARSERSIDDKNWRASLQIAQDLSVKNLTLKGSWFLIQKIAFEWHEAGEIEKAHQLGRQMLDFWTKSVHSKSKQPTKTQMLTTDVDRLTIVGILIDSGLFNEAIHLLVSYLEPKDWRWENAFSQIAKRSPYSLPRQILQLPITSRRIVLRCWADGLVSQEGMAKEDLNSHNFFIRSMF